MTLMLMIAAAAAPVQAAPPPPPREVSITNATGALREWQPDPADRSALFVRDRTLRWYRVVLSGDCLQSRRYDAIRYTTENAGAFDRTSRVTVPPGLTCLVTSVQPSAPPASVRRRR